MPFFWMFAGKLSYVSDLVDKYSSVIAGNYGLRIATFIAIIVIICLFILKFCNSISKRNLVSLNLRRYNTSNHPMFRKIVALIFYLIEYIIVTPLLILLWFAAMAFVLLIVSSGRPTAEILFIAVAFIGAIRVLAYYKSKIARSVAELFPFTALAIYVLTPGSVNLTKFFSNTLLLPNYFEEIISYMLVVFFIEIILRVVYELYELWLSEEEYSDENN